LLYVTSPMRETSELRSDRIYGCTFTET
jgi:hypothetical protein